MPQASLARACVFVLLLAACRSSSNAPAVDAGEAVAPENAESAAATANEDDGLVHLPPYVETGDLPALKKRGVLRVLVESTEENALAGGGSTRAADRERVLEFARRQGLKVQFVLAPGFSQLLPMLKEGKGDIAMADMTVTKEREQEVAFTRAVAAAAEIVIGRKGATNPKNPAELGGRSVHVRRGSAFAETLATRNDKEKLGVVVVDAPDDADPEQLAYAVAEGKVPLTVVDSHVLAVLERYEERIERLFPIAEGRKIAWAVRKENPALKAALDAYLVERALTAHQEEWSTGDLDELRKRGSIRVLTQNSPVTFYLHRGQHYGFDFDLARMAAKALGLRIEMVVPPTRDDLVPWLLEGRGDVIAASFGVSEERAKQVAFSTPYLTYDEVIVQAKNGPKIGSLEELKGKRIAVRPNSSTHELLVSLQATYGPFEIVPTAPDEELEETVERVAKGEIPFAVMGSHGLQVELSFRDDVEPGLALPSDPPRHIAFAVRPQNAQLLAALDAFVKKNYRGLEYNMARRRYFENRKVMAAGKASVTSEGALSPYDALIRRYARQYGLDWRLMAAQAYQESRFDPTARSWVGALGLFQVMPTTGRSIGFSRLEDPEESAHAGIKYMYWLLGQIDSRIPLKHRLRFALAAYNAGLGHVLDAQRLAAQMNLDPHKWFGHVEKTMLLLENPKYYRQARHGYCRGREPVKYVSEIQSRYDDYVKLVGE